MNEPESPWIPILILVIVASALILLGLFLQVAVNN